MRRHPIRLRRHPIRLRRHPIRLRMLHLGVLHCVRELCLSF
jgi:hypothetical protein